MADLVDCFWAWQQEQEGVRAWCVRHQQIVVRLWERNLEDWQLQRPLVWMERWEAWDEEGADSVPPEVHLQNSKTANQCGIFPQG